ncbi:MAG: DUF111 family protein, partial [Humidesulfovibrio sp.]|nr:DUF111 family protein [Humidesulfovibrio sp.]
GLCLVKTMAAAYGPLPLGSVLAVGYGSGTYSNGAYPTFLRAYLIEDGTGNADHERDEDDECEACHGHDD